MSTPTDIISKALSDIGALSPGEPIDPALGNDAFDTLNDMLDQWSNQRMMVPYITEIIHTLTNGVYQYTIGPTGTINGSAVATFAGTVMTVTGVSSGAITIGQTIAGANVSSGVVITQFNTGAGTVSTAPGTYTINRAQTLPSTLITTYYQRPLRINDAFVRVSGLDYPVAILNYEEYMLIGLKGLNGPWPRALYYQPSMQLGNITYWPNPGSGEMHLFADSILANFTTMSDIVNVPQGYKMAMRWNLAELLMPSYGKNEPLQIELILKNAAAARAMIKRTNAHPPPVAQYDDILKAGRRKDAGWILHGGFL